LGDAALFGSGPRASTVPGEENWWDDWSDEKNKEYQDWLSNLKSVSGVQTEQEIEGDEEDNNRNAFERNRYDIDETSPVYGVEPYNETLVGGTDFKDLNVHGDTFISKNGHGRGFKEVTDTNYHRPYRPLYENPNKATEADVVKYPIVKTETLPR
jgi:hypothetical protein